MFNVRPTPRVDFFKITWVCSFGVYELFPKPLGGNTSAFSECREFRPDDVRIDRGLSYLSPYPQSLPAITFSFRPLSHTH